MPYRAKVELQIGYSEVVDVTADGLVTAILGELLELPESERDSMPVIVWTPDRIGPTLVTISPDRIVRGAITGQIIRL